MDVAAFLGRYPPFDALDGESLEKVGRSVQIEFFPAGVQIIEQAGQPAKFLYVVRRGGAEVVDDGRVLDLLGEGEAFGHLSLLSGLSPTATVRAAEDTICYLVDAALAEKALATHRGLAFVSSTLRRQIQQVERSLAGERADPRFVTAGSLIRRRPVTCESSTTIRDAAEVMARERVSSLLVPHDGSWGILTDRDLRTRVLAAGKSPDIAVAGVMTYPATTIVAETMAAEVLSLMLEGEFHHFPIIDAEGRLLGVITDTDLMRLERYSPFALKSAIARATDEASVVAAGRDLPRVVSALVDAHADPVDIGHVVGVTIDALTSRLIELAAADIDLPPVPWAWMALGSAARHEQALRTDQDHAMAFDPKDLAPEELDPPLSGLARRVTDGLQAAGIPRCQGGAMAENPEFRLPVAGWEAAFRHWMTDPRITGSIFTSIVFDYRRVSGPLEVEAVLDPMIMAAPGNRDFLQHLGRRALDVRPPTGFFGDLVVEEKGEHAGRLDVKHRGITLITNLARAHSIAAGLTERRTIQRLRGAARAGHITQESREGLEEAFRTLWHTRLEHQVSCVERGMAPDDFVDPKTLGPMSRRALKEAFHIIARAQKELAAQLGLAGR